MAGADIKTMPFGYVVGGTGADETEIFTDYKRIKLIMFAGNADDATCTMTTKDNGELLYSDCGKFKAGAEELDATLRKIWFGDSGARFHGLKLNLSHANDRVYIYLV